MLSDPVAGKVLRVICEELDLPSSQLNDELGLYRHPSWDSLRHVGILLRLESEFSISLTEGNLDKLTTVKALIEEVRNAQ